MLQRAKHLKKMMEGLKKNHFKIILEMQIKLEETQKLIHKTNDSLKEMKGKKKVSF